MFVLCYPENNPFTLVVCVFVICCKDRLLIIGIKDKKVLLPSRAAGLIMERIHPQHRELLFQWNKFRHGFQTNLYGALHTTDCFRLRRIKSKSTRKCIA